MHVAEAPTLPTLVSQIGVERFVEIVGMEDPALPGSYVHWDKLRHLTPPTGLTHAEWWLRIKIARRDQLRPLPLTDPTGVAFSYSLPDDALRRLLSIDQRCSGEVAMDELVTAERHGERRYLVNAVMEEAIRSSQLEGATTSRRVAKELLRSGRPPRDRSERMIRNNYAALRYARDEMGAELAKESVLELHRILTDGTLDDPDAAGRLQHPEEQRVAVFERTTGHLLHQPPPAQQLPDRLEALCAFANDTDDSGPFIHPVVRAIVLHFWLAYDHPFEDGNGRTARALFYWYLRTRGYWLVEYLSISRILREAPSKYSRSFLLSETDEGDTTYFLLSQLRVMIQAVDELHAYLRAKLAEVREVERLLRDTAGLNHRQIALLGDAVREATNRYTLRSHATSHDVTEETARADLNDLVKRGLLMRAQEGRRHVFLPAPGLAQRLEAD